jgi:hypothetical protein
LLLVLPECEVGIDNRDLEGLVGGADDRERVTFLGGLFRGDRAELTAALQRVALYRLERRPASRVIADLGQEPVVGVNRSITSFGAT